MQTTRTTQTTRRLRKPHTDCMHVICIYANEYANYVKTTQTPHRLYVYICKWVRELRKDYARLRVFVTNYECKLMLILRRTCKNYANLTQNPASNLEYFGHSRNLLGDLFVVRPHCFCPSAAHSLLKQPVLNGHPSYTATNFWFPG
jgi:hypothetical protein